MNVWIVESTEEDDPMPIRGVYDSEETAKAIFGEESSFFTICAYPVLTLWKPASAANG